MAGIVSAWEVEGGVHTTSVTAAATPKLNLFSLVTCLPESENPLWISFPKQKQVLMQAFCKSKVVYSEL